jgi:RimJ/RimL family protein N-acetyltransferase
LTILISECTFIVLDKSLEDTPGTGNHGGGMVGDVNLFWNDHDDPNCAEIEIMVARKSSQRKGLASEALSLFMAYAAQHLSVSCFRAKILETNIPSQQLFCKLGFKEVSRSEIFKEIVYEYMPLNTKCNSSNAQLFGSSENQQEEKHPMLQFGSYDANFNGT